MQMEDSELVKIIGGHVNDGLGSDRGEISTTRREIFDRYTGELYGDEKRGQSRVTTRDIMETIEWTLPPLLRHFTAGDPAVMFEAEGEDDEEAAKQETHAVQQQFWKDNSGFTVLYLIIKSILMNPNGYVKVFREEGERVIYEIYRNMDIGEIAMIEDDPEMELIESDETEVEPDPERPDDDGSRYDVKVKRTLKKGRNLVCVLPEDEVVIDSNWTELDLDECPFVCHYPQKTHSDLMSMGVDEDFLEEAYGPSDGDSTEESNRRNSSDEHDGDQESHKALREYTYHECSMLVDFDDDGIAERRRVVMINKEIWSNEEDDEQSIISGATILMPHKHVGISLAQLLLDLQEINTVITRQTMDNMFRANNPRTIALKGANIADILANRRNGVLRAKTAGDITMEQTAPIIGQVIPLLELVSQMKEMRSGITKSSTVPSIDMLQNSAEGSYLAMVEKADQRVDLLARLLSETVIKRIFIKLHGLIQRNGDTKEMKLAGKWIRVDPTSWRRRETMTVRIGLGHSTKGQKMAAATMITQDHNMLIQQGVVADPEQGKPGLITLKHVYNGRKLLVEALGERDADDYYQNPDMMQKAPPQQPPPDANILMIQSNERIEQGKGQLKIMEMRQKQQMVMLTEQAKAASEERDFRFKQLEQQFEQKVTALQGKMKETEIGDKETQARLKLELESTKAQLADAQHDEQLELDKYKADLASKTQLVLKRMELGIESMPDIEAMAASQYDLSSSQASVSERQQAMDANQSVMAQHQQEMNSNQQAVRTALSEIVTMIADMRQPKQIEYDATGEIIGVRGTHSGELKTLRRDLDGNPTGLE
jgi:hypothetical protein